VCNLVPKIMLQRLTCCRWDKLNLVRVYTKPKGKLPDYTQPVVLRANKCTVEDFVSKSYHNLLLLQL
jgi:ribosome-interacting GTPase 1